MTYFINLFTEQTWREIRENARFEYTGQRQGARNRDAVRAGDVFLCYMTGSSRFVGALRAEGPVYEVPDEDPRTWSDDLFPVRFPTSLLVRVPSASGLSLAVVRMESSNEGLWGWVYRNSLNVIPDDDGHWILERLMSAAQTLDGVAPEPDQVAPVDSHVQSGSVPPSLGKGNQTMSTNVYTCDTCGWVYDPADFGGKPLADQDGWECPQCQAGMDHFDLVVPDEMAEPEGESDSTSEHQEDVSFDIPLAQRKVSAHKADNSVFELHRQTQRGQLHLQPTFQRYYVWTERQASALVESVFLRLPIPLIYLAEERDGTHAVVDGQQRLTALFKYMDNEFAISGLDVLANLNGKRFQDLAETEQQHVENFSLAVVRIDKESHPEIKFEVFERLNTGSVKLNDQEVRNAVFRGPYNDALRTLAKNTTFMRLLGYSQPHKRMSDVELVLRFAAFLNQTYLNFPTTKLKPFLNREMENGRGYSASKMADIERQFKKAVDLSAHVFGGKAFRRFTPGCEGEHNGQWESQINKALYDVVMYGFTRYNKNQIVPHGDAIHEALVDLVSRNRRFVDAITSGTASQARVKARFEIWLATLSEIVDADADQRTFSIAWKEQLWRADPTCALCGQRIHTIDDAHVHHVEHYWRGGRTLPQNSQLVHRFCNLSEGGGTPGGTGDAVTAV